MKAGFVMPQELDKPKTRAMVIYAIQRAREELAKPANCVPDESTRLGLGVSVLVGTLDAVREKEIGAALWELLLDVRGRT